MDHLEQLTLVNHKQVIWYRLCRIYLYTEGVFVFGRNVLSIENAKKIIDDSYMYLKKSIK